MKTIYYREKNGDYLRVDYDRRYSTIEARATAIAGLAPSVCTTSVSADWIEEECTPVVKKDVPDNWLSYINPK